MCSPAGDMLGAPPSRDSMGMALRSSQVTGLVTDGALAWNSRPGDFRWN